MNRAELEQLLRSTMHLDPKDQPKVFIYLGWTAPPESLVIAAKDRGFHIVWPGAHHNLNGFESDVEYALELIETELLSFDWNGEKPPFEAYGIVTNNAAVAMVAAQMSMKVMVCQYHTELDDQGQLVLKQMRILEV